MRKTHQVCVFTFDAPAAACDAIIQFNMLPVRYLYVNKVIIASTS
jgi:hypothetical protein